ncbi:OmpA family protein [Adhaeribacter terreus]|uniref:OmpA family protein n=2 Tax=Adhaeribacter terreus TaxID=529703 RepID=A0ABW0EFW2_9BACT
MKKIIVSCLVLSVAFTSSCSSSGSMSKADKKFAKAEYENAIELYQADIKNGKDLANANFKIAEAYRMSNRLPMAESYYKAALDAGSKREEAMFYYGMALKANGKYDEATAQIASYAAKGTKAPLVAQAKRESNNLKNVNQLASTPTYMIVTPVDAANSASSDYAPVLKGEELIFSSSRGDKKYAGNGEGFTDVYALKFDDAKTMTGGTVRSYDPQINLSDTHDAAVTFSADGNTMIFARGNTGSKKGTLNVDLFISRFKNGVWSEPKMISVNDRTAWDSSPALSPDGKTLYFSSDRRKGGQGGNDIWKSTIDANGRFSAPVNLGPTINTAGNENFPYVAEDGTLYISSDGHAGLGMLDIFRIEKNQPVNLGSPINSNADDFSPYMTSATSGIFASNRAGGKGGDDIYMFTKQKPKLVNFFVDGSVNLKEDKKAATPAANLKVVLKDNAGKTLQEAMTDAQGKFSFKLDTAASYSVVAEKANYITDRNAVVTAGKTPSQSQLTEEMTDIRLTTALVLDKIVVGKAFEVKDINYDYDKWDIREDAAVNLDSLVMFLNDNPKVTIELSSHTDSRGKDAYNQTLSQKRAEAAVDYIVSKGIDKARITAKGYGESKPKNKCKNGVKCTEEQFAVNRRTEFKITKVAK